MFHLRGTQVVSAAACLVLLVCGCASTARIPVTTMAPGAVSVGPAREIVLVAGRGQRPARDAVARSLDALARRHGYFRVVDRSREGWQLDLEDSRAQLVGRAAMLADDAVAVRIDIGNWQQASSARPAEVELIVSVATADGLPLLSAERFVGRGPTLESLVDGEPTTPAAVDAAVAVLLEALTPREVVREVELDDGDDDQLQILELASSGNIARAHEELRTLLERSPGNAAAAYNLAVLTEALGRYPEALALYDRALAIDANTMYRDARAACAETVTASDAGVR